MITRTIILAVLTFLAAIPNAAQCQQPIALIDAELDRGGWKFDNGREFPGARGGLEIAAERFRDQPVLALHGDFTQGGNYVQAAIPLPDVPVERLSFWLNVPPGVNSIPIRLIDATSQCHQLRLKLNDKGGWQQIVLPVDEYFRKMGTAAALDVTSQYEKWGGANDGRWHQPGKLLVVLCSRALGTDVEVLLSDAVLQPGRAKTAIEKSIPLDELLQQGELDWTFNLGQEFRGAKGGLDVLRDQPEPGKFAMHLHADFTGGGAYVGVRKSFASLGVQSMNVIRMKMRSETTSQFAVRLVDSSGQAHQRKTVPFTADGKWHEVEIVPIKIAGGEHWGGANDGQWHGSVQLIEMMLNTRSNDANKPDLYIADIRADVVVEATAAPATFSESFESAESFGNTWRIGGDVKVASPGSNRTSNSLVLQRTLDTIQTETTATSAAFDVTSGMWQLQYSWKSSLHSPDNSYHGSVALEVLDPSAKALETIPLGIGFGESDWQVVAKNVLIPQGASQARLHVKLNKTYGSFHVDELSASRLKVQPIEPRIDRVLLSSDALGNLFLPGDSVVFHATVEANKPLPELEQMLSSSVRDYWGASTLGLRADLDTEKNGRVGDPTYGVALTRQAGKAGQFIYTADIALPSDEIAIGKYYELHVEIPQGSGAPVTVDSGFAILPTAITKEHAAENVPFSIRNWDGRIPAYLRLADRLGLRMLGVWGGWSSKPPYKPHLPGLDICKELDVKWITGTPASQIERNGFAVGRIANPSDEKNVDQYSEESLRTGMRNFLEVYADQGLAMIATGNEPHGTGEKVLENVRAYRAIYETVKAFDPKIHVIGTSVEPNEEYFRAGYQNFLDSYDFHIYEHYTKVRDTMRQYRELMKKYDAVKPIHSTELGLNSQGQTRLAVSREMIKKIVSFFAEGGATVSWFTIQYPDPKGTARGQFGDSHCMFDCKYNLYNPRLDAITHYHLINAICVKKFVQEKHYPGGAQAYLFRDEQDRCLQVLWLDGKREDVFVPMSADGPIRLIYVDGTQQTLQCADGGVTLTLSDEPLLLLYNSKDAALAESLGDAAISLVGQPAAVRPGTATTLSFTGRNLARENVRIVGPSRWTTQLKQAGDGRIEVHVESPPLTTAREARIHLQLLANEEIIGEIQVPVTVE